SPSSSICSRLGWRKRALAALLGERRSRFTLGLSLFLLTGPSENAQIGNFRCNFIKCLTGCGEDGVTFGEGLPAPYGNVDIERIDFETICASTDALGREDRRAASHKGVEHDVASSGAIANRVGDKRDWFHRRMNGQFIHPISAERVHPSIAPNIGAVAAVFTKLDIVLMRGVAILEHSDELMR